MQTSSFEKMIIIDTKNVTRDFWTGTGSSKFVNFIANYIIQNQSGKYPRQISFSRIENITPCFANGLSFI